MKNVWILNHYATAMYQEQGGRHYWFAKNLMRNGWSPTIFCANTLHSSHDTVEIPQGIYFEAQSEGIPFVFVKATPYKGNGLSRVYNMATFAYNLEKIQKDYVKTHGKPDVILASSVHPFTLVAGLRIAKRLSIPCICEIRDLWPESIISYGMLHKKNPLAWLLYRLEKWIYTKADALIFTMEGGKDYIIEKGWDTAHGGPVDLYKVHHINNGVDLEAFDYNKEHYILSDPDLDNPDTFKVIYTGSIRQVNGVEQLVYAAETLRERRDIAFLLYGQGDKKASMEEYCQRKGVENVRFKGAVEKKYIPYALSKSNLNIVNSFASPILRYGWSANKMMDYLASGKPMLANFNMSYSVFEKYACGEALSFSTAEEYAAKILEYAQLSEEQNKQMCAQAKLGAQAYDIPTLTQKLIQILENI